MADSHIDPDDWWSRVSEGLEQAIALGGPERQAFLERLEAADPALRREVESLLAAHAADPVRFEPRPGAFTRGGGGVLEPGAPLGPYRIVRAIGEGGMGTVYEAHREGEDFRKRVAIKTISPGRSHGSLQQRFRRERRILARLEHRNIAALFDGGLLPDGSPWFAMEYVEGEPIDAYCAKRGLPLHDRLHLVRQVCGAVQVAHQNLVVHRDLKPGNILVTADGTVKLLDFGIAKILSSDDDSSGAGDDRTAAGAEPFTLAFASPEQVRGEPVTTASDVYALGMVLFAVAAGRHPFRDESTTREALRERILDRTAPGTGQGADLDAIVQAALHKDPARRYASAEQLGEDLRRLVEGRPDRKSVV